MPFEAQSPTAPLRDLYSMPLITTAFPTNEDDSDEWEYEYSTTETEVSISNVDSISLKSF